MDHGDDDELAARACSGDEAAWTAIYDRYVTAVWNTSYALTRHPEDAKEVTQLTFIKVSQKLAGRRGRGTLRPWILSVCRNTAFDLLRSRRARQGDLSLDHIDLGQASSGDPYEQLVNRMMLERALQALSENERVAFLLRRGAGYTAQDAAQIVGCPVSTLKSRDAQAIRKLLRLLDDYKEAADHD